MQCLSQLLDSFKIFIALLKHQVVFVSEVKGNQWIGKPLNMSFGIEKKG